MANEIPPPDQYHFRIATKADAAAIVSAETHSSNADSADRKAFQRALYSSSSSKKPSFETAVSLPEQDPTSDQASSPSKAAAHISGSSEQRASSTADDSDFEYVYRRLPDPTITYLVIGYFLDASSRPGLDSKGELPMIEPPLDEDTTKEHIVGFAQWQHIKGRSLADWESAHEKARKARNPRMNRELLAATSDKRWEGRKRILKSRDYLSLNELYIDQRYQKLGLGSRLLKWGIDEADKLGLPVYIESTSRGETLYKKFGLIEVDRVDVHLKDWGEEGEWSRFGLMLREPSFDSPKLDVEPDKNLVF